MAFLPTPTLSISPASRRFLRTPTSVPSSPRLRPSATRVPRISASIPRPHSPREPLDPSPRDPPLPLEPREITETVRAHGGCTRATPRKARFPAVLGCLPGPPKTPRGNCGNRGHGRAGRRRCGLPRGMRRSRRRSRAPFRRNSRTNAAIFGAGSVPAGRTASSCTCRIAVPRGAVSSRSR